MITAVHDLHVRQHLLIRMGGLHPGNRLHAIAQHKGSADLNNIQVWCDPVNDLHSLIPVSYTHLDIGGDKTLPYWDLPKEENPFLGKRALRLCLEGILFLWQIPIQMCIRDRTKGKFPTWLAPTQVKVLPVSEKTLEYAQDVTEKLSDAGVRVVLEDVYKRQVQNRWASFCQK